MPSSRAQHLRNLGVADTRVQQALSAFWGLIAALPEVQAVAAHKDDDVWTFRTYIERRDLAIRHRIYDAEDAIAGKFRDLRLDFYVLDLEGPGREVECPEPPGLLMLKDPTLCASSDANA